MANEILCFAQNDNVGISQNLELLNLHWQVASGHFALRNIWAVLLVRGPFLPPGATWQPIMGQTILTTPPAALRD